MANKKITSILSKAKKTLSDNERVKKLLAAGKEKLDGLTKSGEDHESLTYQLHMIIRMIRAHISGEYSAFSIQSMVLLVFALLYFIIPMDLLPDFIPAIGFTDDISIVLFVLKSIRDDVAQFELWEEAETE
ncbi:MAG: uncharacterized membrane protein YkvA (DUF1232 family) [Cyclobacteriaceae bacterium]|jgi:uncharacterized membrane protein YkvA (DUF1232 family)